MKRILLVLFLITLAKQIFSQNIINGKITNKNNEPLELCSVILFTKDGKYLTNTTSDSTGYYKLKYKMIYDKNYILKVTNIAYDSSVINFNYTDTTYTINISLNEAKTNLDAVTVKSQPKLLIRKADRFILNIEGSFLAEGNSALEVLQKAPGIWVSADGNISIRGSQSATVMINDIIQKMTQNELVNYLNTLKSEEISKIEIIPAPPSEFEASGSGGIIRIILKKPKRTGTNESLFGSLKNQKNNYYWNLGGSFNSQLKNVYLYGTYAYTKDPKKIYATNHFTYKSGAEYKGITNRNDLNTDHYFRIGSIYTPSNKQTIGLEITGDMDNLRQQFVTNSIYQSDSTVSGIQYSNRIKKK